MYHNPYNNLVNMKLKKKCEDIDKKIKEEREKETIDKHKILRLEEQKLIQGLFSNELGSSYGKYRNPW